jgi:integrase
MPRRAEGLSAAKVAKAVPGRYGDGAGLYLLVRSPEAKFWLFRYRLAGRSREMGLGPAAGRAAVSLADARAKARQLHERVREGKDPLAEREAEQAKAKAQAAKAQAAMSFRAVAELYVAAHEAGWRSPRHRQQWRNTLDQHVMPSLGEMPVAEVATGDVMHVLETLWRERTETASRVRGRIEAILDYAKARGWRAGENPARWRGHLQNLLPNKSKLAPVVHHPALPWPQTGALLTRLRQETSIASRAAMFCILTATRSGEVRLACWGEINFGEAVWIIPAEHTKARRTHRVPLAACAVELLREVEPLRDAPDALIFPGTRHGPLADKTLLAAAQAAAGVGDVTMHANFDRAGATR